MRGLLKEVLLTGRLSLLLVGFSHEVYLSWSFEGINKHYKILIKGPKLNSLTVDRLLLLDVVLLLHGESLMNIEVHVVDTSLDLLLRGSLIKYVQQLVLPIILWHFFWGRSLIRFIKVQHGSWGAIWFLFWLSFIIRLQILGSSTGWFTTPVTHNLPNFNEA